jgi:hypothetical protein
MNTKGKQTRAQTSGSASNSGGSSPVIISCSTSATLPQPTTSGPSRGTAQASNRSTSLSHATSHARMNNPNLLARINVPTPGRPIRTSPTILLPIRRREPKDEPEEAQQFITLNSLKEPAVEASMDPLDSFGQYKPKLQEAYEAAEEQEVVDLASPEKDDQDNSPLRQKEDPYSTMGSSRPGRYQFVTD